MVLPRWNEERKGFFVQHIIHHINPTKKIPANVWTSISGQMQSHFGEAFTAGQLSSMHKGFKKRHQLILQILVRRYQGVFWNINDGKLQRWSQIIQEIPHAKCLKKSKNFMHFIPYQYMYGDSATPPAQPAPAPAQGLEMPVDAFPDNPRNGGEELDFNNYNPGDYEGLADLDLPVGFTFEEVIDPEDFATFPLKECLQEATKLGFSLEDVKIIRMIFENEESRREFYDSTDRGQWLNEKVLTARS